MMMLTMKDSDLSLFGRVARWSCLGAGLWVALCFGWSLVK